MLQYLSIGGAVLILDDIGSVSGLGLTLDPALGGPTRSIIRESGPGLAIISDPKGKCSDQAWPGPREYIKTKDDTNDCHLTLRSHTSHHRLFLPFTSSFKGVQNEGLI